MCFLYRSPLASVLSFPESVFVELMEVDAKSVSFNFNDNIYRQVDGISMGFLLGPILENIFVGFYEKLLIYVNVWMHQIVVWFITLISVLWSCIELALNNISLS